MCTHSTPLILVGYSPTWNCSSAYIYIILGQACKFPYPLVSNLWPAPSGLFSPLKFPSCNSHSLLGQVLHRLMHCDLDATCAPGMWWGCGWDLQLRPEHRSGVPSWLSELWTTPWWPNKIDHGTCKNPQDRNVLLTLWVGIDCPIFLRLANCKPYKWSPKQLSPAKWQVRFSCIPRSAQWVCRFPPNA
jgi:hypothetical protein